MIHGVPRHDPWAAGQTDDQADGQLGTLPWKVARDPFLAPLASAYGVAAVMEAGFFEDSDPLDAPLDNPHWLGTPIAHVRAGLGVHQADHQADDRPPGLGNPPVVLLATGGFHPVHDGHLAMMHAAHAAAHAAGWAVLGGYLSPGHAAYLAHKCGPRANDTSSRLTAAHQALSPSEWLAVDPWESTGRRVAVMFTDVVAHLQSYLRRHLDPDVDVVYVCGGDNARFALAFAERGRCIVVGRPGHEATVARWRHDPRLADHRRVLWAEGSNPRASSGLRASPSAPGASATRLDSPIRLFVRTEGPEVVGTVGLTAATWGRFQDQVLALLRTTMPVVEVPAPDFDPPEPGGDRAPDNRAGPRQLSLGPFPPPGPALMVSRRFDLGGIAMLGHVARPGAPPIEEQAAAIPPGEYVLTDDDACTGATLSLVRSVLPDHVIVTDTRLDVDLRKRTGTVDLVDARDFLLGADQGGLVVALPDGTSGRAPYLRPFVDPGVRCRLPDDEVHPFCEATWRLNAHAYEGTSLRVADLPPAARATMLVAGFDAAEPLVDVCRQLADLVADTTPLPVTTPNLEAGTSVAGTSEARAKASPRTSGYSLRSDE